MQDADPFGRFRQVEDGATEGGVAICIGGGAPVSGAARSVFVDSKGWLAAISLDSAIGLGADTGGNCLGALAAAALAVGQAFKLALGVPEAQLLRNGIFDLFRLAWDDCGDAGDWPGNTEIGRILMVGAGSVGSSAAYCMKLAALKGYAMQQNVPPLMVHASTTANWGVNHARHIPTADDCLADRFPVPATEKDLACATGEVAVQEVTVDAALPFCSFFAGLLVAADLVRANLPGYPQVANFALFDWFGPMDSIQVWDRKPRPDCICRQQHRRFHTRFNAGTRYWPVFRF